MSIMKYVKKPVEIEALQIFGNITEIKEFIGNNGDAYITQVGVHSPVTVVIIHTLEGDMRATDGDYIIKGVKGEFYPCRKDIFEETYEKIDKLRGNEDGNNIRFYIPDSLTIPTDLILYVEDTYVNYKRIHGGFRFHIHEDDEIKAMGIAKQIADRMIFEHDESEHGVTWCTVEFKIVEQEERYKIGTDIDWFYRIRDSY